MARRGFVAMLAVVLTLLFPANAWASVNWKYLQLRPAGYDCAPDEYHTYIALDNRDTTDTSDDLVIFKRLYDWDWEIVTLAYANVTDVSITIRKAKAGGGTQTLYGYWQSSLSAGTTRLDGSPQFIDRGDKPWLHWSITHNSGGGVYTCSGNVAYFDAWLP